MENKSYLTQNADDIDLIRKILTDNGFTNIKNITRLPSGSRSKAFRVNDLIVRIPVRDDAIMEQEREAEISKIMQQNLPTHLQNKVTNVYFNGKCAYHQEIKGELLNGVYAKMNSKEHHQLAIDIAELLSAIHRIPISDVQEKTQKYLKICRNENKTAQQDFDYSIAKLQILDASDDKINLDDFKIELPTDNLVVCHNDLHCENIVVNNGRLSGFIDFGEAGINPRLTDFFHLYRLDRDLAVDVIKEYNKISDCKIDIKAADYQFLSNTGYTLEQRKHRPSFKQEVAKVLENFVNSYQRRTINTTNRL